MDKINELIDLFDSNPPQLVSDLVRMCFAVQVNFYIGVAALEKHRRIKSGLVAELKYHEFDYDKAVKILGLERTASASPGVGYHKSERPA